jgi:hypothetical protein
LSAYIVFSNSKKIGSRVISWGSIKKGSIDEIPSHMSFLFFNTFVYESRLESGVAINEWDEFKKKNKVIRVYDLQLTGGETGRLFKEIFKRSYKKKYDWKAILYLAWRQFLWKFFNINKPKVNKWESVDKYFCNELYELLELKDISMITPYELMIAIENRYKRKL